MGAVGEIDTGRWLRSAVVNAILVGKSEVKIRGGSLAGDSGSGG